MKVNASFIFYAFFLITGCQEGRQTTKPNVLFISIDDLRPALGAYGDSIAITPNIDRFAAEGITFMNTFCQSAACAPSRASLMTGLRPDSTRVWHLGDKFREINPSSVTIPQHFATAGYHTVNIGKIFHNYMPDSISWHEPDLRPAQYKKPEWLGRDGETFYISKEISDSQVTVRDSLLKLRPIRYADGWNSGPAWEKADVHDTLYYDGAQTELAKRTLTRIGNNDQPFFMALGFFRPHLPFAVPKKYWDLYDIENITPAANPNISQGSPPWTMNSMYELRHYDGFRHIGHPNSGYKMNQDTARILKHGYYASISYVDALLGDLMEFLKAEGLYDNTIIILWGDHGWKLGEHNSWGKMTNYNIDLRVPMMIRYPNQNGTNLKIQAITELVDIFPSLCELADIESPDYLQGDSFVPLISDIDNPGKGAAFSQFHRRPQHAYDAGRYMGYSINTLNYHYIEWYQWDADEGRRGDLVDIELYDVINDPSEKQNIASLEEKKSIVAALASELELGWKAARASN